MAERIVRCPYCILADDFRPMNSTPEGWFVCIKCGHSANPVQPDYKCHCQHCVAWNAA
jgi:DNA-directed RNA polymerase subunit RPC12/RpoP